MRDVVIFMAVQPVKHAVMGLFARQIAIEEKIRRKKHGRNNYK
jgi:hypothetical protein